jgi:hypothetical protein
LLCLAVLPAISGASKTMGGRLPVTRNEANVSV